MRTAIVILITLPGILISCYKVYDPKVDRGDKVLVVNGMITNNSDVYHIRLFYAEPFNSIGAAEPATEADVYVTDDLENRYQFNEKGSGDYISDSIEFSGISGRSYRLHILTPDGHEYESDYQRLYPEVITDSVYAEFTNKESLNRLTGFKVKTPGADILADVKNNADTLPRFRMELNLVNQYFYQDPPGSVPHYNFYCWQTESANTYINLTGGEYNNNFAFIRKFPVGFVDNYSIFNAKNYYRRDNETDSSVTAVASWSSSSFDHHGQILYLNQYTINNETYEYYKSLDAQIQSEGKLFDPIAAQLTGNIKCISDPLKKVIGFFEASSVSFSRYKLDFRNLINSQPAVTKLPYILPPEPNGCRIDLAGGRHSNIPAFWIFI